VLALAALVVCPAHAGQKRRPEPVVSVKSVSGGKYLINGSLLIPSPPPFVREVVTDFDHLAEFIPNLKSSRVVSRGGDSVVVRQLGSSSFIVTRQVDLTILFRASTTDSIPFHLLDGSIDEYDGSWRFLPEGAGVADSTHLVYRVTLGHGFHIPGILFRHILSREVGEMMPAIAREVARRRTASSSSSSGRARP